MNAEKATLAVAGIVCEVEDWSVDFDHELLADWPTVYIQVTVPDEGRRRMLSAMACLRDGFGAAAFALVLDAPGYRVAAAVAWFTHTEQPGGVFRFKALEPQVKASDVQASIGLTIEPAPEPAAHKSTVCPCGIHRADCEYHR